MDKILLSTFLLVLGIFNQSQAQTLKKFLEAGEKSYAIGDYYSSFKYYQVALEFDDKQLPIWKKFAHSAMQLKAYPNAEEAYAMIVNQDPNDKSALYWLAYSRYRQGKYESAETNYDQFLQTAPDSLSNLLQAARNEIENCGYAITQKQFPKEIPIRHLDTMINTAESEFAPYLIGDSLFYSSLNYLDKKDNHNPPRPFARVMKSVNEQKGYKQFEELAEKMGQHISNTAFNAMANRIVFTLCEYVKDDKIRCDLYTATKTGNGAWNKPQKLTINAEGFTSTHPSIGWDKELDQEILYFVSDRPGGRGGLDIWSSEISADGSFNLPVNLIDINSTGDDISPSFHTPSQRLYFSSDGYDSFGGYDIYNVQKQYSGWSQPYNMGYPLNTSYDETFYFRVGCSDAYFASNRRDSSIILDEAKETCCSDIYAVEADLSVELDVFTFNNETKDLLIGATVEIYEVAGGAELLIFKETHDGNNEYLKIPLERCKEYLIKASKPGFKSATIPLGLNEFGGEFGENVASEFDYSRKVKKDIFLDPLTVQLVINPCDADDKNAAMSGVKATFSKLNADGVQLLVSEKESNGDPVIRFTAYVNQTYELKLTKEGYLPRTDTITISDRDVEVYGERITIDACLERDPFPDIIRLFFDNNVPGDHPNLITSSIYDELYEAYYGKKPEFIEEFTKDLDEGQKFNVTNSYEDFFERQVDVGKTQLTSFCNQLLIFLQDGNKFIITIKGFSSPRGASEYNEFLSSRRIESVINFLREYDSGRLLPYMNSGSLVIKKENFGESTAAADISTNLKDRKNSIFSVVASLERRVEITVTNIGTENENTKR